MAAGSSFLRGNDSSSRTSRRRIADSVRSTFALNYARSGGNRVGSTYSSRMSVAGIAAALCIARAAHAAVTISTEATSNMSCSGGVCTPTAQNATLNVGDLQTMLASGNVTVAAAGEPVDIDIQAPFSWSSATALTLDSYHSVNVGQPFAVTGNGGLSMVTNDGGSGGWLTFAPNANVAFSSLASILSINGASYTLAGPPEHRHVGEVRPSSLRVFLRQVSAPLVVRGVEDEIRVERAVRGIRTRSRSRCHCACRSRTFRRSGPAGTQAEVAGLP